MTLRAKLRRWYDGEPIPDDNDYVVIFGTRYHWSSRFAHTLVDFYFKEWKWIWGSVIALGGLLVAIAKLH